eukprot:scaffold6062_cov64-Phaeocystis_antarctica.AAC.1
MATSTRVVRGSGGGGAVSASTISCMWCTITSIWRDARRMDVMLKGCNPNRAIRSARSGPNSPSAHSAYAASSACGGARGYQGEGRRGAKARVVSSPPPPRPSSLCQVLPARCPRPRPPPAKVQSRCRKDAEQRGRAVRMQRRHMQRVNGRKESAERVCKEDAYLLSCQAGADRAYTTRTVAVGYGWPGLEQHQPGGGAAARMRRHRHVVRQRGAEGGANQYVGRGAIGGRVGHADALGWHALTPYQLLDDERRVLGAELGHRRLAQRCARTRGDVPVLQRVEVTLGL